MPTLPWSKSNRSQHSSVGSSPDPSPVPSVHHEAAALRYPSPEGPRQQAQSQQPQISQGQQIPQGPYRQVFPTRTSSHRHSSNLSLDRPPINVAGAVHAADNQPNAGLERPPEQQRYSYHPQPQPSPVAAVQQQEHKKPSLRSRLVAGLGGHSSKDTEEPSRSNSNKNGLGRRVSVRKSDAPAPDRYQSQQNDQQRLQAQQWQQRQGSNTNLAPSNEQDEDDLDPFLQQEDHDTPQVPPKDSPYHQHQQQFVPNQVPEQYRPPLARVNTESSYHTTQGGVDHYSPEQHSGLQPPQQQYQPYPAQVEQQSPQHYQAFQPQSGSSPILGNVQLHPQELAQQQQNYYYQQQQQQQAQQQQQGNLRYQQQQLTPTQSPQEYQNAQQGRPPSQHQVQNQQPELHHPQAIRQPPQNIQQISQQGQLDTQTLQQLRPPSQHQHAPPSPLTPQYQAYDPHQGPPSQGVDNHSLNEHSPPRLSTMAPSGNQPPQARNTLRKVNEPGQQGPPTRESSLLQPSQQGQSQRQPPTPGVESFGTNVVPPTSQGQPYRGPDKQGQQGQGAEMGRSTPPPRNVNDMTDEEVHQLMKDHDVLREKYQKVKRYFFEQQTQVHQLQNTLANQRLSLSRTAWDDSEYATRFNRLDGLIAQLSFAIRKDWKTIPPWLQPVVNKNAVETGKQEMTAVGRAFITSWLVEQIFEKYFHPDLEPGLSTQLKIIQLNIRRFAPVCQNAEEEEGLVAKVVNWRLATLEGLSEMLRSPHSATNRHNLVEELNEKLIASIQMHMNDPAPPDLNGGVPMIIELAVNIAQHLPLESRDVHIEYFPPGHSIMNDFMKLETGCPALTNPIVEIEDDRASLKSVASEMRESTASSAADQEAAAAQSAQANAAAAAAAKDADGKKGRGMFSGIMGSTKKGSGPTPAQLSARRESTIGQGGSQQSLQQPPGSSNGPKDEPPARVRMAVGVAVQIRGKSILIKAPVYST